MQQAKIAEQVKAMIDREMAVLNVQRLSSSKQQRYAQADESRGNESALVPEEDEEEDTEERH